MHKLNLDTTSAPIETPVENNSFAAKETLDASYANDNNDISMTKKKRALTILGVVAVMAGIATGYGGFRLRAKSLGLSNPLTGGEQIDRVADENTIQKGDIFGVQDPKTFKDSAEGYLESGGIDGEGSHKLVRPGGDSQTVYLTSSITDLDKFTGMEVKIWGETFKGQKAGWLMDVGRVEIINPDGNLPTEE